MTAKPQPAIGIDLGTTFSAIAHINQHGKSEIVANREGERITPSVVLFDGDESIVGTLAKRAAATSPLNVCQLVKRQMGERDWRFVAENNREYTAEAVSALILRRLINDAEVALETNVTDAVITVPAYFNDAQRKATQDAGRVAGLETARLVNEPTAAALAYGLNQSREQTVLVYDLGGGTFDVTIMCLSGDEMKVLATAGDKNLGGFDWDNRLMAHFSERFQQDGGVDLSDDVVHLQDLREKAEIAKKTLSSITETKVFLSASGKNVSVTVSREQFAEMTTDLLGRTEELMTMCLEDASLQWPQINTVLLVGGSTRMPAVPALLERVSGRKPSTELHPDEVVATGAAVLAKVLTMSSPTTMPRHGLPGRAVVDVNSHSLGVVALRDDSGQPFNSIILPRNTAVQTRVTETYHTVADSQTEIEVQVTEGEDKDVHYVRIVGVGKVTVPPYPKGAPVAIAFQYDENGIIHITVHDKTTNRALGELQIDRQSNRSAGEIRTMRHEIGATIVR